MLSLKRYGWLCVLGGEVAYLICLSGGYLSLRTTRAMELHRALFETLPGFVWGSVFSIFLAHFMCSCLRGFSRLFRLDYNTSLITAEKGKANVTEGTRIKAA